MLQIHISCWGRGGLHPEILKSLIPTFSLLPACTPQRCLSRNQGGTLKRRRLFIEHVRTPAPERRPLCCACVWQIRRNAGGFGEGISSRRVVLVLGVWAVEGVEMFSKSAPFQWKAPVQEDKMERSLILGWWGTLANAICESGLPTQYFAHCK